MIRKFSERHTPWLGMAAAAIIALGALVAAWGYDHDAGHAYSFLRQNISDLGKPGVSTWSGVFNGSLMLGAALMACFIAGVSILAHTPATYGIAFSGIIATVAMAFVGVFPAAHGTGTQHEVAAGIAFLGTLALGASFSLYMLVARRPAFPRWLLIPGLLTAASATSFLLVLCLRAGGFVAPESLRWNGPQGDTRVDLVSLLEWCVLFSILAWSFLTATTVKGGKLIPAAARSTGE